VDSCGRDQLRIAAAASKEALGFKEALAAATTKEALEVKEALVVA
jgi:hypothetical protein